MKHGIEKQGLSLLLAMMLALLFVAACGGGGSGGGGGGGGGGGTNLNSSFSGDYRSGVVGFDSSGGWADLVEVTADGNGNLTATPSIGTPDQLTYTVQSDRVLSVEDEVGQLSQDGTIFHLVNTATGDADINISVGLKKGSGMTEGKLIGIYNLFAMFTQEGSYDLFVARAEFDFSGDGEVTFQFYPEADNDPHTTTYSVADDGLLTIMGVNGQVSADGEIFFFTDGDTLAIGIKVSSGMQTADAVGTFHSIYMGDDDVADNDPISLFAGRLDVDVDVSGDVDLTFIDPSQAPQSDTFTVANDGTVSNLGEMIGQLSSDAGFFILADDDSVGTDSDGDRQVVLGILKP